ncbi:imelysin family protein [Roseobacter litoralis]|uniref:Imelysin peptidase n=1 Tax=Roseobacter litoralis (strain ATCC 49566 / DSM 6996 / JCM 21268 / NBRC 15278 / OCh 149) TaxID=391595 RepID=F7ZC94_ROSLO|nr:imelysin family protein [Roseobacter litoralis]AEI95667.1 putative imelysin peptidase [Roseobacter litoralis Och 149]
MRLALIFTLIAAPAVADVSSAISDHILPGHARLVEATEDLSTMALADCTADAVRPAFATAYDAWVSIAHIQFGPIEDQNTALAMAFWPDPKDRTGKALTRLFAAQDVIVDDAAHFNDVSVAAQGFTALERLLFEPQDDPAYACRLTRAIATGLAQKSENLNQAWPAYAKLMVSAGAEGNTRFQSPQEAQRALYTALSTGLEFLHDQRLGRPLGTFDRPRPLRAEARRSERSVRHIILSLTALEDLAVHVGAADLAQTRTAFAQARSRANALDDPALAGVADPASRFRIEALQQSIRTLQVAVIEEIGTPLGISAGFNALDGD